ncbi:HAEPLYID family protein [Tamlana sp. 2201CG12-4]|uniref:HAEPLYID family protein n=1 Tax=Tamlana sp. 2201CG12-4 TaxID=3112582 RepID=UPI002DBD2F17|nr:HAEPLYID family protein [Tamlana sp. 2201CG12-4]MEC3905586.1 HAEPLYID family protein [Tamlana sp. 2201CG12-4]
MNSLKIVLITCYLIFTLGSYAQDKSELDSLYIHKVEDKKEPGKVLHAEPLYIDLIRDLGARKGEKEWNLGVELKDNLEYDVYEALVEYEWAPIDRLGLEIELPFKFYGPISGTPRDSIPSDELESLKLAAQWSFYVNESTATSMALGYINEFEFTDFRNFGSPLIKGNIYNPFFVIAKRWGNNFHTLIYTGPMINHNFRSNNVSTTYDINTNIHYMISGTNNFIGIEINKTIDHSEFEMTIRPQMRVGLADNLLVGIVAGIPVNSEDERLSSFLRIIWEPEEH